MNKLTPETHEQLDPANHSQSMATAIIAAGVLAAISSLAGGGVLAIIGTPLYKIQSFVYIAFPLIFFVLVMLASLIQVSSTND